MTMVAPPTSVPRPTPAQPHYALLGSYPPRACGIATFTADVAAALNQHGVHRTRIIAVDEPAAEREYPPAVTWRLQQHDPRSYLDVAAAVGRSNVRLINIQHEYGLFGGDDGELLLTFMAAAAQPIVTTLHTVLPKPTPHLRAVTRALCNASATVVVLAQAAIPLLRDVYGVDPRRVSFIPHGIPSVPRQPGMRRAMKARLGLQGRTVLSTFGLINPDKGIEYVLHALPPLVERFPDLLLLVIGETHPGVRRHAGERYREGLQALVADLGLGEHVQFINRYQTQPDLIDYLIATDIYLMAYLNPDQIVSGTLAYAVGCGKAVVATPFRYAQELLAGDRGVLVPFRDPSRITDALEDLLTHPSKRAAMEARAYAYSRMMAWPNVAAAYHAVFQHQVTRSSTSYSIPAGIASAS